MISVLSSEATKIAQLGGSELPPSKEISTENFPLCYDISTVGTGGLPDPWPPLVAVPCDDGHPASEQTLPISLTEESAPVEDTESNTKAIGLEPAFSGLHFTTEVAVDKFTEFDGDVKQTDIKIKRRDEAWDTWLRDETERTTPDVLTVGYLIPWSQDWEVGPTMGAAILLGIQEVQERQLIGDYQVL